MPNPAPGFARRPDHVVALRPAPETVALRAAGREIARSDRAVLCEETGHPPRRYLPIVDVAAGLLVPTDLSTHCPFKGDARYWTLVLPCGGTLDNAAWAYDAPFDECAGLAGLVCFDEPRLEALG